MNSNDEEDESFDFSLLEDNDKPFFETSGNRAQERDLFVPIFALVAIAGFGACYAYETLRYAFDQ